MLSADTAPCRVCGGALRDPFTALEQHLGLRTAFAYARCERCDLVQLVGEPPDMDRYYPSDYYAWAPSDSQAPGGEPARTRMARRMIAGAMLRGGLAASIARSARSWIAADFPSWLVGQGRQLRLRLDTPVLDVGCGAGVHLRTMARFGFSRLAGVDAHVPCDREAAQGVPIRRGMLDDERGRYGCVMFHHSLEHMADPLGALRRARELLLPGAGLLVRIPVLGAAWREYRADWVQLDAPRHRFLFGVQGFRRFARAAGFDVVSVRWDSNAFQFWGSEQYRMGIALAAAGSHARDPAASVFEPGQIAAWQARAERLNEAADGDQACFVLHPARGATTG